MRGKAPPVRDYMSHLAIETERCDTVAAAETLMKKRGIHHLPVMSGSHLRGVVTQNDILAARLRYGENLDETPVEQICQTDVLTVEPNASIDMVANQMLERQIDSAIVTDGGFVVGVFTATDALRVLTRVFGGR